MKQRNDTRPWKGTKVTCYKCHKIGHLVRDYKNSRRPSHKCPDGKRKRNTMDKEQYEKDFIKMWTKMIKVVKEVTPSEVSRSFVISETSHTN